MWAKTRTLGELQILTRASYFMLLFVPVLAGLWPVVRVAVNGYNDAVTDSTAALEMASQRIELVVSSAKNIESDHISEILNNLKRQLEVLLEDYAPRPINKPHLPSAWAFAFLASLSVTVGHLIYQAMAPALIKKMSASEFRDMEVKRFVESPSMSQLAHAKQFSESSQPSETRFSRRRTGLSNLDEDKEKKRREEISIIDKGALAMYFTVSERGKVAAFTSIIFYLIGLGLIAWVVVNQTMNVINATWGEA